MIHTTSNQSITHEYRPIVEALASFTARQDVLAVLHAARARAEALLAADAKSPAAVENLDIRMFPAAPSEIGSVRVAVIRAGFDGGNERHPNSTQYLFSLDGTGETHVEVESGWRVDKYGAGSRIEDRFHVVPAGVWHKSAAPGPGNWTVVALHTAEQVEDDYDYPQ